MSYAIQGIACNTRNEALTLLVAEWVSAGGANDLETIKSALHTDNIGTTVDDLLDGWADGGDGISLGTAEEPAFDDELIEFIIRHRADIIAATDPADVRARRERDAEEVPQ